VIWRYEVQDSAYDSDDLRLLSAAHSEALETIREVAAGPLTPPEISDFSRRLAQNLMSVFDAGERNPAALRRAALKGVLWEPSQAFPRERADLGGRPVGNSAAKFPNNKSRGDLRAFYSRSAT
jgi:hypothetical protein